MPTARELLEQADALMRRNRARDAGLREPAAEAVPVPAPPPAAVAVAAPLPDIPVLTDAVHQELPAAAAVPAPAAAPVAQDVPMLTEAVADIEAMPLVGEAEQGEPSFWIDAPDEDKSVLGVAPDSVAVVPPADHVAAARAAAPETAMPSAMDAAAPLTIATPTVVAAQYLPPVSEPAEAAEAEPEPEPEFEEELAIVEQGAPEDAELSVSQSPAGTGPLPAALASAAEGDERWRQLAEDVRMQVLQRIDMFTDTGLREQLGERLKPIVDRASADLVDTINQHVGELLRSYVAEAIEREIERWRHDGER